MTGGLCFVAGTPVLTPDGLTPIEQIAPGALVWSRDSETGEEGWSHVGKTFARTANVILELEIISDEQVEILGVTESHPFWVNGTGWVPAGELIAGDQVLSALDGWLTVGEVVRRSEPTQVYNFEVERTHTYFVGETTAFVHNADYLDAVLVPELSEGAIRTYDIGDLRVMGEFEISADGTTATVRAAHMEGPGRGKAGLDTLRRAWASSREGDRSSGTGNSRRRADHARQSEPRQGPTTRSSEGVPMIALSGWLPGMQKISFTAALRDLSGSNLAEAKGGTDTLLRGGLIVVEHLTEIEETLLRRLGLADVIRSGVSSSADWFATEMRGWALEGQRPPPTREVVSFVQGELHEAALAAPAWLGLSLCLRSLRATRGLCLPLFDFTPRIHSLVHELNRSSAANNVLMRAVRENQ